jgi:dihydrofolate reductase
MRQNISDEQLQEILRILQAQQHRQHIERVQAARRAAERQTAIDEMPRRRYAVIVALDNQGGFSKDNQLPWHFPRDLKWFKDRTDGQIVLMGRTTYENINARLGTKAATVEVEHTGQGNEHTESADSTEQLVATNAESVLPRRRCFVLTSTVEELPNAHVVKTIAEVEHRLTDEDNDKTIFLIGGERVFWEGIALADTVYVTVVNGDYNCDKFFPTEYLMEHFHPYKVYKREDAPELRFTIWKRRAQ